MTHKPAPIFDILVVTLPGLEPSLLEEVKQAGFQSPKRISGGVMITGGWDDVWRANLTLRGASKILARIGEFPAFHLAQLDKRARKFPWGDYLKPGFSVKAEVSTNRKSKIYHQGAAQERIERAISEEFDAKIAASLETADIIIKTRIESNLVIFSIDTSGIALHKRGHKQAMGKAPLRETIAAMTLRACGYDGREPVLDPMCGSGTYVIEAAEMAGHKMAGRAREFAFEKLASYDAHAVKALKDQWQEQDISPRFYGFDQNKQVIDWAQDNARRAEVLAACEFSQQSLAHLKRPDGPPGLVITNPPYGNRIGDKKKLLTLYQTFGDVVRAEFTGWRAAMVTTDTQLAQASGLPWKALGPPIAHGGLKLKLFQTGLLDGTSV